MPTWNNYTNGDLPGRALELMAKVTMRRVKEPPGPIAAASAVQPGCLGAGSSRSSMRSGLAAYHPAQHRAVTSVLTTWYGSADRLQELVGDNQPQPKAR